jgi:hypothetical protein
MIATGFELDIPLTLQLMEPFEKDFPCLLLEPLHTATVISSAD